MLNKDPATLAKPGGKSKQEVDDEAKAAAAKPQTKQPTTEYVFCDAEDCVSRSDMIWAFRDDEKASKPKAIRKNSHSGVTVCMAIRSVFGGGFDGLFHSIGPRIILSLPRSLLLKIF